MARPKENREQHVSSPEKARARFLERHPSLGNLIERARDIPDSQDLLRWLPAFVQWVARFSAHVLDAPAAPEPTSGVRRIAQALGGPAADLLSTYDSAQVVVRAVRHMAAVDLPDFYTDIRDRKMLLAVFAVMEVEQENRVLDPLDLVLLEVASVVTDPAEKAAEYLLRLDAARERLRRARAWVKRARERVSPETAPRKSRPWLGGNRGRTFHRN